MSKLSDLMYAQARINPIKPANRIQTVTKMGNGSLHIQTSAGEYTITPEDEMFQAFAVYTMLNTDCN